MKSKWFLVFLIFILGCQAQTVVPEPPAQSNEQPAVQEVVEEVVEVEPTTPPEPEEPTAVPTVEIVSEEPVADEPSPTAIPEPEPTEEPVEEVVNFMEAGRTPLGAYYLGSPDAPIRMIDYSDFL